MRHNLPEDKWQKSSFSGDNAGGNCVQIQMVDGMVALGDSKNPNEGAFEYTHDEWTAFIKGAKDGQFDL